jgi:hypothetical protein
LEFLKWEFVVVILIIRLVKFVNGQSAILAVEVVDDCELCLREESISVRVILIEDNCCVIIACWLLGFLATLIAVDLSEFF